jgi:BCD family chlorophyll transporter-like MFS transporter
MNGASTGYTAVYQIEILLLFATLVAIGPLVRSGVRAEDIQPAAKPAEYELAEYPH